MRRKAKPAFSKIMAIGLSCMLILLSNVVSHGQSLQEEFDSLCIHTQDAEDLSLEKLQELVMQCDSLQKKIAESNDEKKKVLLFRLKKCCDFLTYVMEIKQSGN